VSPSDAFDEPPSGDTVRLRAPAKVNLGLRVVGRRDDGYHLLESVFAPLDWADDLVVRWRDGGGARVSLTVASAPDAAGPSADVVPTGPGNLAHRAAERFLAAAGLGGEAHVTLTKRLPAGAGLGGGSSDAGAVLRGLAALAPGALSREALGRIAAGLGADVPFFLDPRPAWVGGVGEHIEALEACPELLLVLANPGDPLATAAVFAAWDALRVARPGDGAGATRAALDAWLAEASAAPNGGAAPADALARLLVNDLEPAATRLCPPIARLRRRLAERGARATAMSGSGATVYGVFEDAATAEAAAVALDAEGPGWVRTARTTSAG
jgi:4-diphosphocytidyl-2-C-methyl-D-erythritol kinase